MKVEAKVAIIAVVLFLVSLLLVRIVGPPTFTVNNSVENKELRDIIRTKESENIVLIQAVQDLNYQNDSLQAVTHKQND